MRKGIIVLISFLFISVASSCQNEYELEDKAWSCVKENFNKLSFDLETEFAAYEEFLVQDGYLPSATPKGYMAILDSIEARNIITPPPIKEDFMDMLQRYAQNGEKAPCLTPEELEKTKLYTFQMEAEKVYSEAIDLSPRLIASTMKKVYEENDFAHPFYRLTMMSNLALLISQDIGISRELPPPPSFEDETPLAARNIIKLHLDHDSALHLNGEPIELNGLNKELLVLLEGSSSNDRLPELAIREIELLGTIEISKAVISFTTDSETLYTTYLEVQNELNSVYTTLREKAARKYFNKGYDALEVAEQDAIKAAVPKRISEI